MPETIESTRLGTNRTGMQMSPAHSQDMLDNMDLIDESPVIDDALAEVRLSYIAEADPLGTVPPPGNLKGVAKAGAKILTGHRPQAFVDKLAERLAFERSGTRLYDAVLVKFRACSDELSGVSEAEVLEIRNAEAAHANLISRCITSLGADPTAQTPCADLVGIEGAGFLQAASDPRTSLAQTLHTALSAELIDNAGWENLIALAESMGNDAMADEFRTALAEERQHLQKVTTWYNSLTLGTAQLV